MKKFSIIAILFLSCSVMMQAQEHVISIGLRGGGSHFLQKAVSDSVSGKVGANGGLDFGYTCYFLPNTGVQVGIHTGLGVGISTSHLSGSLHETFTNTDMYGNEMDYTVDFNKVDEQDIEVQAELPIMFALRWKGLVFNVGPKLMVPVWKMAKQDHSTPVIDAYYPDYDVHVTDEVITGSITNADELNGKGQWCSPTFNFMLGLELGYEFKLKDNNLLGLMATMNISAATVYKNEANGYVVKVSDIQNKENPVPDLTIQSLSNAVVSNMHPLDFGVKLYYAFDIPSNK